MSLDQFRGAFRAGGLRSVGVTAAGGVFYVTAEPQSGGRITLATTRGKQPRRFRDPGKAIALLHAMGAHRVDVQAAMAARTRPDTAERQRRAHEAASHAAWFRAEVEQALREADDPATEWLSDEAVKTRSAEYRARWRARGSGAA